jgi:hypothetical protein
MEAFRPYVRRLQELLKRSARVPIEISAQAGIEAALDGQPADELRRCVPVNRLRAAGAFLTGSAMDRRAIAAAGLSQLERNATVLDPTCGFGDLLLALVENLPRSPDFASTLSEWGGRILGRDLEPEFVRATKLRLALAAIGREPLQHTLQLPKIHDRPAGPLSNQTSYSPLRHNHAGAERITTRPRHSEDRRAVQRRERRGVCDRAAWRRYPPERRRAPELIAIRIYSSTIRIRRRSTFGPELSRLRVSRES